MPEPLRIVIFGLSVTSSWGNGHATTYRSLMHGLHALGHDVLFCERSLYWYARNRDLIDPPYGRVLLYRNLPEAKKKLQARVREADLVIVGSYVPDGAQLGQWITRTARGVTAFYDIDTPVTVQNLERDETTYVSRKLVPRYHLYLSFTGGPILRRIELEFGASCARPLYCCVDPAQYTPLASQPTYDLGYMGTYSADRQPFLDSLLLEPARRWGQARMIVAGPQYPRSIRWPKNVKRVTHLSPAKHRKFYASQRFTLNITRAQMRAAGYSPSIRLFEAAACGTPIITDEWPGLDQFFRPNGEILIARSPDEILAYLRDVPDEVRISLGTKARQRVLSLHTSIHRATELCGYVEEVRGRNKTTDLMPIRERRPSLQAASANT